MLACPKVMALVLHQMRFVRTRQQCEGDDLFLFPAQSRKKEGKFRIPSYTNPVGHQQFVRAMQRGLVAGGLPEEAARLRKGHSMRVGGSEYMRRLGIADDVHRRLGGWMSLVSSRGYMHMSIEDRMHIKSSMGLQ